MFQVRARAFLDSRASCIRLPAAVAFPTDERLMERIEKRRRMLPVNSIKPLRRTLQS